MSGWVSGCISVGGVFFFFLISFLLYFFLGKIVTTENVKYWKIGNKPASKPRVDVHQRRATAP